MQVSKQDPEALNELALPDFPEELELVWHKFNELSKTRSNKSEGCGISSTDMYHWSLVTGWSLSTWEVEVIMRLNDALLIRGE